MTRLLHLFLNNRGTVLSHEFLARSLWGDKVDSSALVKKYIQRLRRKLDDDPQSPQWIANVHGIGYRFLSVQTPQQDETVGGPESPANVPDLATQLTLARAV